MNTSMMTEIFGDPTIREEHPRVEQRWHKTGRTKTLEYEDGLGQNLYRRSNVDLSQCAEQIVVGTTRKELIGSHKNDLPSRSPGRPTDGKSVNEHSYSSLALHGHHVPHRGLMFLLGPDPRQQSETQPALPCQKISTKRAQADSLQISRAHVIRAFTSYMRMVMRSSNAALRVKVGHLLDIDLQQHQFASVGEMHAWHTLQANTITEIMLKAVQQQQDMKNRSAPGKWQDCKG
eukprot:jgi/Ulvmu1/9255/UM050_0004.1